MVSLYASHALSKNNSGAASIPGKLRAMYEYEIVEYIEMV